MIIDALRGGDQLDRDNPGNVASDRSGLARGDRSHGHMVLLPRRGRDGIDARRKSQRFVLADQRSGGDLRDHEPRVEAAVFGEEGRKAAHLRVDQNGRAPLGDAAHLA